MTFFGLAQQGIEVLIFRDTDESAVEVRCRKGDLFACCYLSYHDFEMIATHEWLENRICTDILKKFEELRLERIRKEVSSK